MVFKRREKRSWGSLLQFLLWPKGGWTRAALYVKHRLHRLPDNPEKIARGIWAGVFTTFTPFYGLHFIVAGTIALILRGNVLAALLATFFGNPLTYLPIGIISLRTGEFLLASEGLGNDSENLKSPIIFILTSITFFIIFEEQVLTLLCVFNDLPSKLCVLLDFFTKSSNFTMCV